MCSAPDALCRWVDGVLGGGGGVTTACRDGGFSGGTGGEGDRMGEDTKSSKSSKEDEDKDIEVSEGCWEKSRPFDDCGEKLGSYNDIAD